MATSNRHDVRMSLGVDVDGNDDIKKLSDQVRDLAKAGGDAAPDFRKLADEIDASSAATVRARDVEKQQQATVAATKLSLQAKKDALKLSSIETDNATKKTAEYQAATKAAQVAIFEESKALRTQGAALRTASAEAKAAAVAQKVLATEAKAALASAAKGSNDASVSVDRVSKSSGDAAALLSRLGPLIAGAFSAQHFVQTITAQESLNRGFEQIFGSATKAGAEMEFIRTSSNKLGLEVQSQARAYQSLAAATKGTALEGQATREVFVAVSRAMSTLGKSSVETERALVAISQIASKGTASMEELRGQLGEALPGAMKAAADGAGITVEQLIEMVSSGSVLASDILPALTKGLNDLYAKGTPPQTITSEWARLQNTITGTMVAIGEGGASKGIAKGLGWLTLGVQGTSNAFDVAGTAIGEFVAGLQTGNLTLGTAAELNAKYDASLRKAAEAAGLIDKAQTGAAQATQAQVRAVDNATESSAKSAAADTAKAQSMLAVKAQYTQLLTEQGKYVDLMQREQVARQAESTAMVQLVSVYGSEIEKRQAVAIAADTQATAARNLARAKETEAIIAESMRIRLVEEAQRRGDNTEATKKEILTATQSAQAKRAEADQSRAVATSKGIEVEAAKASTAAYADNASRVYELRGAASAAAAEVERLVAAQKAGKATSLEVADAQAKASAATLLYRDALRDATEAAERRITVEQQTARTTQAAIEVDIERASAMRDVAAANGNAAAAGALQQRATELQAQAADAAAAAARREAQAIRDAADARENELRATGELTTAKKAEIDAQRKSADLKDLEAQKADILADKTRSLAASEQARTQVLEQQISTEEKRLDLMERQDALERRKKGIDKNGFTIGKDGAAIVAGGDLNTRTGIVNFLRAAGVDDEATARRIASEFTDARGNVSYEGSPGLKKYGGDGSTISTALAKAAESYTFSPDRDREKAASAALVQQAAPVGAAGGSKTVNVNINGRQTPVNVASDGDANSLVSVLRQLETASGTSA